MLVFIKGFLETAGFRGENDEEMIDLFLTLMKIQMFENKRYERMKEKHIGIKNKAATQKKASATEQLVKETKFMNKIIAKQNQIFYLILLIAKSIAMAVTEMDPSEAEKILPHLHEFLKLIVKNLDRKDQALILLTLDYISEFVRFFGAPPNMKGTYASLRLQRFFDELVYMTPYLIFAQLFVRNSFSEAELKSVVPSILKATNDRYFRDNITNLISLISSNTFVKETLIEKEYYYGLLGMYLQLVEKKVAKGINKFEKFDLMRGLINSLINLANQPEQANLMIKNPLFKKVLQYAFDTKDIGLLKLVNNITAFCEPAHTLVLHEKVRIMRDALLELAKGNMKQTRGAIFEIIGILSNCCLAEKWEGFLNKDFLEMMNSFLKGQDGPLRLQTLLLTAQLCRLEKNATIFQKKDTLDLIFHNEGPNMDREELFQKLFVAYHLLLIEFPLDKYLTEILDIVETFLEGEFAHRVVRVVSFLNEFIFILQIKYQTPDIERLVIMRSQLYNEEWEAKCGIAEYGDRPQFEDQYDGSYPMAMDYEDGMEYQYGVPAYYDED